MYNGKCLKTKIKSYDDRLNVRFDNNGVPKEGSYRVSLSIKLKDSVCNLEKNCHRQKYVQV